MVCIKRRSQALREVTYNQLCQCGDTSIPEHHTARFTSKIKYVLDKLFFIKIVRSILLDGNTVCTSSKETHYPTLMEFQSLQGLQNVSKALSMICHSHRRLLMYCWCMMVFCKVHPLQSAWICTVSLWADLKGNPSRVTYQPKICNVSKVSLVNWQNCFNLHLLCLDPTAPIIRSVLLHRYYLNIILKKFPIWISFLQDKHIRHWAYSTQRVMGRTKYKCNTANVAKASAQM